MLALTPIFSTEFGEGAAAPKMLAVSVFTESDDNEIFDHFTLFTLPFTDAAGDAADSSGASDLMVADLSGDLLGWYFV